MDDIITQFDDADVLHEKVMAKKKQAEVEAIHNLWKCTVAR